VTPAPIPADDHKRVRALHELGLLDTVPEERFDRIARFAAKEFEVPIALISLVDSRRQWFKSRVGLQICETSRDVSLCAHAILQLNIFVVEDTHASGLFRDNPLVVEEPRIRFYAGAQLRLPRGEAVGTLCLMDTVPRKLDALDCVVLGVLRDQVLEEMLAASSAAVARA
jgi:GAF domain-containing protein